MKTRFVHENGTAAWLRTYWNKAKVVGPCEVGCCEQTERVHDCPNCLGSGTPGYHNAEIKLGESDMLLDYGRWGTPEDYADDRWPTKCDHCPATVPHGGPYNGELRKPELVEVNRQIFTRRRYSTPSGRPEPGDVYWAKWHHTKNDKNEECCLWWDNCSGKHLIVVLPNGMEWDTNSRSANCTLPNDRNHRCWVLHGTPEAGNLTVDKNGNTCNAGAGSIMAGNFHGFLKNGEIT